MLLFKFPPNFFAQLIATFNKWEQKTFRTNYLSPFVVSHCPTYQHVLNWAVSVSLFCRPGLLIWIFIGPQMIYQNIWHLALPSHMLHAATCVFIICWHADRVIVARFYFSVKTTHPSLTIEQCLTKHWPKKEYIKRNTLWMLQTFSRS